MAQPTDSISNLASSLISLYFKNSSTNLSRYAIDSYNYFVNKELPELLFNQNPTTILKEPLGPKEDGQYVYKTEIFIGGQADKAENLGIEFGYPIITLDGGKTVRRMFPQEARLRNLSYSATVLVDIRIKVTMTTIVAGTGVGGIAPVYAPQEILNVERKSFELFKLPIMLRSTLCVTNTIETHRLTTLGECQYDQGGYFIVDGAEKVLITSEDQAFNSIYAGKKPQADQKIAAWATCSSLNPKNKQIRRTALFLERETGAIRVSLPFVRGTVPLFIVFRAFGIQTDKDIVQMIVPDLDSDEMKILEPMLIACIHDAYPITDSYLAIQFLRTLTKGFLDETVLDILINNTFMHVPNTFQAKALFLGEMSRQLLRVAADLDSNTDRDDIRNKRYLTAGTLVRELFTSCWKQWIKLITLNIDKEYNYNRSIYEGMNFVNMFSEGNLPKMMDGDPLNLSILRGFRGKWGTDSTNERKGVIQPLARISYMDAMSQVRRVSLDFTLKSPGPRRLHPSQCGFFCISEVPSGFSIGITKNASIFTIFSLAESTQGMLEFLYKKCGVVPPQKANQNKRQTYCRIQVNGGTVGFIRDPEIVVTVLKLCKQTGCTGPTTSISFNRSSRTVKIFMDEGRPCRPLWILRSDDTRVSPLSKRIDEIGWKGLIKGILAETRDRDFYDTGFVDPFPTEMVLQRYVDRMTPYASALEYVDPYEQNEAYISWNGSTDLEAQHTHCEIHPSTMFGFVGSMIPFANHNQSPRNQLSCSQSKQGIGFYSSQFMNRFDTYGTQMCYGEAPIARTLYYDLIADGNMPYGVNCIVALASFDGYNMDDGILFNSSSIERGLFRHLSFKTYDGVEEKDSISGSLTKIGNPNRITNWTSLRPGVDYSQLDEDGIIKEGAMVDSSTALIGRYTTFPETGQIKDASITPTVFTQGRVEKVVVLHQQNGFRLVHIRIFEMRVPELGDKFSSRHGQKGTIGMLRPAYDLPRCRNGITPDIIVNPHCIPSRMTVAQIMEMITSKVGAQCGAKMNATCFTNDERHHDVMGAALEAEGFDKNGEEIMYSPFTGKQYTSTIFSCPLYFMRLRHLTMDKLNARGAGRKEQRTHQPTGGRGNEGGLRIGEMERDVLIGHGIANFLDERMMKCSDEAEFWLCNSCGQIPIFNEEESIFVCPSCDGPVKFVGSTEETIEMIKPITRSRSTFAKVKMPYAFKLLNQELGTYMNLGMRFVHEGVAARLKDESWDWTSISTEEARIDLKPLPEFEPAPLPSSGQNGVAGPPVSELEVLVEKEEPVEPLPPNPLIEAERKRADEAEAALAAAEEAEPKPETFKIELPEGIQGPAGAGPPAQRGGGQQITINLTSAMKGAGRPATGQHGYVPKKKGVRINEMFREQQGGGEEPVVAMRQQEQKGGGPVTIRVQKDEGDTHE